MKLQHGLLTGLALLGASFLLEGCGGVAGLAVGAAGRAAGTGATFAEWKGSAPPMQPHTGRLVVYVPSRQPSLMTVDWGTGGEFNFAVDRDVCDVIGDSFVYLDLPPGRHAVSAGDMQKFLAGYRKGQFETQADIVEGRSTFVRIEPVPNGGPRIRPVVVSAGVAEAEMAKLPLDKHFVSFSCKPNAAGDRGS